MAKVARSNAKTQLSTEEQIVCNVSEDALGVTLTSTTTHGSYHITGIPASIASLLILLENLTNTEKIPVWY